MEKWISLTATNSAIPQKWKVLYAGANRCNDVLKTMAVATDITADKELLIEAQARFLRGFYHFELKKVFKNIPYADENLTLDNTDNTVDAWPKIEADLQFAVTNLPDSWSAGEPGRANVWAAKAMLAKVYMYEGKLDLAYPILTDVIANGKTAKGDKYALNPHFYSNFYVYQYATSIAASSLFAEAILKGEPGARDRYLTMLKSGGSDYPYELVKKAGVDLATPAPYEALVARMNRIMDEIEAILAKRPK